MSATIYDVAREAGVSMATVSRVVNGNPNVKPTTRKKVSEAIKRLGYRPNAVARGLASKKTTTVGVIIPDISSIFFSELARGIEDIANMYHYNIILCDSDQNKDKELRLIQTLLGKQVDGVVFMGGKIDPELIREFTQSPVPVVLAATVCDNAQIPSVNIDYEQAAFEAVSHLIESGRPNVALINGPLDIPINGKSRLDGYKHALEVHGLPFDDALAAIGDYSYESGKEAAEQFLQLPNRPAAIYVASDEMAIGAIHEIQDQGFSVPRDVAIVSSENTRLVQMVRPTLSSVSEPTYDIGAVAMRLLTKLMNNEKVEDGTVILPHYIDYRQSAE